jgi:hypothetical protein
MGPVKTLLKVTSEICSHENLIPEVEALNKKIKMARYNRFREYMGYKH